MTILEIRRALRGGLATKTSWGRNELYALIDQTLLELADEEVTTTEPTTTEPTQEETLPW